MVLCGKNFFILLYNCVVRVLLCVSSNVGCCIWLIIFVMVKVLFELVIFNSVWCVRLFFRLFINVLIVVGWLFVGWYLEISLKFLFVMLKIFICVFVLRLFVKIVGISKLILWLLVN